MLWNVIASGWPIGRITEADLGDLVTAVYTGRKTGRWSAPEKLEAEPWPPQSPAASSR